MRSVVTSPREAALAMPNPVALRFNLVSGLIIPAERRRKLGGIQGYLQDAQTHQAADRDFGPQRDANLPHHDKREKGADDIGEKRIRW